MVSYKIISIYFYGRSSAMDVLKNSWWWNRSVDLKLENNVRTQSHYEERMYTESVNRQTGLKIVAASCSNRTRFVNQSPPRDYAEGKRGVISYLCVFLSFTCYLCILYVFRLFICNCLLLIIIFSFFFVLRRCILQRLPKDNP
jgi:Flp pilus assembly protein TadB